MSGMSRHAGVYAQQCGGYRAAPEREPVTATAPIPCHETSARQALFRFSVRGLSYTAKHDALIIGILSVRLLHRHGDRSVRRRQDG